MEAIFFLGFIFLVHLGLAWLSMLFFRRFTRKSKHQLLLDGSVLVLSLALIIWISFVIFMNTITISR